MLSALPYDQIVGIFLEVEEEVEEHFENVLLFICSSVNNETRTTGFYIQCIIKFGREIIRKKPELVFKTRRKKSDY